MDPHEGLSRCYGATFLKKAVRLGYQDEQAVKELWRQIVTSVRSVNYSTNHAYDELVTCTQLYNLVNGDQPSDITDDNWRLICAIAGELINGCL